VPVRFSPWRRPFFVLLTLVTAAAYAYAPATAVGSTSSAAIAALNKLRAKIGALPVTEDPALTEMCQVHAAYMAATHTMTHFEDPANPLFSYRGDDAGKTSVLAFNSPAVPYSSVATNPWYPGAPLHLFQLLHPGLTRSGYALNGSYGCMSTLYAVNPERSQDTIITFPEAGAKAVPPSENTSSENPSPNLRVGLPQSRTTGPYILIYATGFSGGQACMGTSFTSASLRDSGGHSLALRKWDESDSRRLNNTSAGSCNSGPGGGYLVPERPLRQGVTYTASVTVRGIGSRATTGTKSWTFTTSRDKTAPKVKILKMTWSKTPAGKLKFKTTLAVADNAPGKISCAWRLDLGTKRGKSHGCRIVAKKVSFTGSGVVPKGKKATVVVIVRDVSRNPRIFRSILG
jgi:hypothetical protein